MSAENELQLLRLIDDAGYLYADSLKAAHMEYAGETISEDRALELGYLKAIASGLAAITHLMLRCDEEMSRAWRDY